MCLEFKDMRAAVTRKLLHDVTDAMYDRHVRFEVELAFENFGTNIALSCTVLADAVYFAQMLLQVRLFAEALCADFAVKRAAGTRVDTVDGSSMLTQDACERERLVTNVTSVLRSFLDADRKSSLLDALLSTVCVTLRFGVDQRVQDHCNFRSHSRCLLLNTTSRIQRHFNLDSRRGLKNKMICDL